MTTDLARDNVEKLAPYEPGKPIEELERELGVKNVVKLASNENPLGPSPKAIEAARAVLARTNRYPDGGGYRLREALAGHLGVMTDEIVLGSGSNDLIDLLVRTFCAPGVHEAVAQKYAFIMFKVACQAHGIKLTEVETRPDLSCDSDALLSAITSKTKLVYLPNPNNPSGSQVPKCAFEALVARIPPHVILIVDEAYQEYAAIDEDFPVAERYRTPDRPLVVTLRTFSKIHGLAGLRVGYGVADRLVVSRLNRVRLPFNVSSIAQAAACAALTDRAHVDRSLTANKLGLSQLATGFAKLGVHAYPSVANFVLVDLGRDAKPVYEALLRKGVIVRPLATYGLPEHLRVSVGTEAENERALKAFAEVLA